MSSSQPAAAALDSNGQGPRASPAGAVGHLVHAMLCIGVYWNNGPTAVLIHLPAGKCSEDNHTELAGGDAGNLSHVVVSKRNMATMSRHRVQIMKTSGPEGTGNGLFTDVDMPMGTNIPVQGVWV